MAPRATKCLEYTRSFLPILQVALLPEERSDVHVLHLAKPDTIIIQTETPSDQHERMVDDAVVAATSGSGTGASPAIDATVTAVA